MGRNARGKWGDVSHGQTSSRSNSDGRRRAQEAGRIGDAGVPMVVPLDGGCVHPRPSEGHRHASDQPGMARDESWEHNTLYSNTINGNSPKGNTIKGRYVAGGVSHIL